MITKITKTDWDNLGMKQSEELENNKSEQDKTLENLNFLRRAFCVSESVELVKKDNLKIEGAFKLVDKKRGTFYIGVLEPK